MKHLAGEQSIQVVVEGERHHHQQEGKTDAEIEQMKAKYQASIDRIKAEGEGKSQ